METLALKSITTLSKRLLMPLSGVTLKYESRVERTVEPGTSRPRSPSLLAESSGDPDGDPNNGQSFVSIFFFFWFFADMLF
jgi:hypothetical protein